MPSYTVVGSPRSRAMRVIWMLEEAGADYAIAPAGAQSPEALAANPEGRIPALQVEGEPRVLLDSVAISQFIADRHGAATHPAGTVARGRQDAATQFVVEELDGPLWLAVKHERRLPEPQRVPGVAPSARWEFERGLERFAARLGEGPWLTGDVFTLPDLLAAHCWGWAKGMGWADESGPFAAHALRARERASFKRAMERGAKAMGNG
jgi:glutathione S-transferase